MAKGEGAKLTTVLSGNKAQPAGHQRHRLPAQGETTASGHAVHYVYDHKDSDQVFEALSTGASGYLLKNTPHSDIPTALEKLYEGGAPMSAGIARKIITALHQQASSEPEHFALSVRETEILHFLSKGFLYSARRG